MPKFEVTVTESRDLIYEVDAVNSEDGKAAVTLPGAKLLTPDAAFTQTVKDVTRKLEPKERVFEMQIINIRADYERLASKQSLADGTIVDDETAETMKQHLATLHDALVDQSGLEIPHLAQGDSLVTEHLGDDVIPAKKTPVNIDNPEEVWKAMRHRIRLGIRRRLQRLDQEGQPQAGQNPWRVGCLCP
jgi:hypothetical protein